MNDSIAAILEREYDENPAYREAVDAYTSRRQPSAGNDCQPGPELSSPLVLVTGPKAPAALAPVAGAGLGGGR